MAYTILNDIEHRYSTDDQRNLAVLVVEYHLHYSPGASWGSLAGWFYYCEQEGALQRVRRYVQKPAGITSLLINMCMYTEYILLAISWSAK